MPRCTSPRGTTPTRLRLLLATAALLAVPIAGCSSTATGTGAAGDRPLIVVTTNVLGDVVSNIVGEAAEVMTLMPPNADPHSFQISAQEAARIADADLLVSNGLGLEEGLSQHIDAAAADGVPSITAGELVDVLDYTAGETEGAVDPHLWTDPMRIHAVVEGLAPLLADAIAAHNTGDTASGSTASSTDSIVKNAAAYGAELEQLDADMDAAFAAIPAAGRNLVTNHHVFGYLADRYNFTVIGAVIPSGTTLAAPSASDLASLVTAIEQAGVSTIFADSSQPDRLVQVLADEAGIDVAVVDLFTESLSAPGEGAETYLEMMRSNTESIATGLSP